MKNLYESEYGASRKITAAQRVAEIVCGRMAAKKKTSLRLRFWDDPEWKGVFRLQLRLANALIKAGYDEEAIFNVLAVNKWIFSLGFGGLAKLIDDEQKKIDSKLKTVVQTPPPKPADPTAAPRPIAKRGNLKQKLKGL